MQTGQRSRTDGRPTPTPVKFVDVHCHCLPNLDDGPESVEEAIALCRVLAADNVSTVVATPHQLGRFEDRTKAEAIRRTVGVLNRALVERGIGLVVLPGAEVRVDERIDALLARGEILTLADAGRHVLLELPWDALIDIEPLLVQFALTRRADHSRASRAEWPVAGASADAATVGGVPGSACKSPPAVSRGIGDAMSNEPPGNWWREEGALVSRRMRTTVLQPPGMTKAFARRGGPPGPRHGLSRSVWRTRRG